jgi:hypothetical protein
MSWQPALDPKPGQARCANPKLRIIARPTQRKRLNTLNGMVFQRGFGRG